MRRHYQWALFVLALTSASKLVASQEESKPPASEWANSEQDGTNPYARSRLAQWLVEGCSSDPAKPCNTTAKTREPIEYQGYDGFYNNLARPDLGAIDTPLIRRVPAAYEDGVYKPSGKNRPNPLELSDKLMDGPIGSKSRLGRNALLVFFGQQVVEEILDAQRGACPPEYFNIKIPKDHRYHEYPGHSEIPLLRTRFDARSGYSPNNPRQQLNEITPWLDGGLTYGTTKAWSDQLRTYKNFTLDENGLLAFSEDGLFPEYNTIRLPMANPPPPANHSFYIQNHQTAKISRFFRLGNPRGNENPFLLTFGVLWFRWHNYIAKQLKRSNPEWHGEKIYNEARKWVIASHQHIVVDEWLPSWLGAPLDAYKAYNPSIDPQIDQFFQSAAFRFGHTLVPPGIYLREYGRNGCDWKQLSNGYDNNGTVRTCNSFWRPQETIQSKVKVNNTTENMDIDRLLMGMAVQLCEEEDHKIVEDLRGNVFGPLEFSRRDLMAVNIQRGRDHGLPDFNTAREAYNLPRVENLDEHFDNVDPMYIEKLKELYNNKADDIDIWVGGLLETRDGPGELFTAIIKDQFERIRDGDRFWFESRQNKLFTREEIDRLKQLTLYDIIMAVTKMDYNDLQPNVFRVPDDNTSLPESCQKRMEEGSCKDRNDVTIICYHLPQLNKSTVADCVRAGKYDYFSNSEGSFIGTFVGIGLVIMGFVASLKILVVLQEKRNAEKSQKIAGKVRETMAGGRGPKQVPYSAEEWVEKGEPYRLVVVILESEKKQLRVCNQRGQLERAMDVTHTAKLDILIVSDGMHVLLRVTNDYDLVLKFDTDFLRSTFIQGLEEFVTSVGVHRERINITLGPALRQAVTRKSRQKRLEMFFRVVFSQAFNISHNEKEILKLDTQSAKEIIYTELTTKEFAEALSMRAESEFVKKMFSLVDKDKNGFISFREFVDMLIIFAKGTADDKAKLMFDMYDINGTGELTREDFTNMIKSFMETVNVDVEQEDLESVVSHMLLSAGLSNKDALKLTDFQRLLLDHQDKLNYAELSFGGIPRTNQPTNRSNNRSSFIENARDAAESMYMGTRSRPVDDKVTGNPSIDTDQEQALKTLPQTELESSFIHSIHRYVQNSALEIFWISLYTLVLFAIFAERSYYYSVEREHSGLRRIAGYGVTVTRGAASAMMFAYSSLLITMCQNAITVLRDTFFHMYFPFDSSVFMHKYIAIWALIFTIMHIVGHAFNFYSISTQTSDDLTCLFRNFFHATHEIPKFHYWCWQTITGVTGVLLTLLGALMFTFALPYARTKLYNAFWFTHSLYPVFYILMILHGAGRLIQAPFLYYFFLGPAVLFALDKVVTLRRKKVEIPVVKAELLPSNVTLLEFKKPSNFEYKSGQWVRIACLGLNSSEYHPFTLSSAPHEKNLTLHIRAVGPWTTNIRKLYDSSSIQWNTLPKIYLDGPYGEGHQDWYQYDVAVLIGGGIGVTPFASILKDIVFRKNLNQQTTCKKVYFLWVTKTQKQFEWLVDIIRDLENADERNVSSVHIFITQFYQKFDLRTILLYICERHFQKVSNRSLFTGLKAVTHFGRPNFAQFFRSLQLANPKASKVGVFSCGPPPMTQSVDKDCVKINQETHDGPIFQHHFKNF